jgi:hypothetical protein
MEAQWASEWAAEYGGEWEEWEEEGSYDYAADHAGAHAGHAEEHAESAVLYQPLQSETSEGATVFGGAVPLCESNTVGACAGFVSMVVRRGFRLACRGAAVLAIACGGDDLQKDVQEESQPVRTEVVGVQRPGGYDEDPDPDPDLVDFLP